jgi:hypothetical protein
MIKTVVVTPDCKTEIKYLDGWDGIKELIGADMLEIVNLGKGNCAYIDEEGKEKQLSANAIATGVVCRALDRRNHMLLPGDYLAGTVVFVSEKELPDPANGLVEDSVTDAFIQEYFPKLAR